jgi:tRNA threonylcarbamoyladenosine modification (KEOPS) complex Cgi121 subunit
MPLPPPEERSLRAVGARPRGPGQPSTAEIVRTLRDLAKEADALVAVLDARAVAGERHLLSAWAHLGRARSRGEVRLRDRGAEFALYVAGDDQLPRALAKVGVSDTTEQFVVVAERPHDPTKLLDRFELVTDPAAYPRLPDAGTLERLGIGLEERDAVPPSAWEGLVLERVALLDLTAPVAHPPSAKH